MKKILVQLFVCLAVSLLVGFGMVKIDRKHRPSAPSLPQADTVTTVDTSMVVGGEPVTVIPDGFELVPAGTCQQLDEQLADCLTTIDALVDSLATKPKIVYDHDTLYIVVPMKDYTFTDGKTYEFAARGYNVSLLWHKRFNETTTITQPVPQYRDYSWTLWPKIGAFAGSNFMSMQAGIGADIAISQNRRLRLIPEAGYNVIFSGGQFSKGFYAGGSIKFNLVQAK